MFILLSLNFSNWNAFYFFAKLFFRYQNAVEVFSQVLLLSRGCLCLASESSPQPLFAVSFPSQHPLSLSLSAQLPVAIRPLSAAELICMLIYLVLLVFVVLVCRSCVIPPAADLHSFFPVQSPVVGTKSAIPLMDCDCDTFLFANVNSLATFYIWNELTELLFKTSIK